MNVASCPKRILVLGGYGSFGSRLCRLLTSHTEHKIFVAGRHEDKARSHCKAFGGTPLKLDNQTLSGDLLKALKIDILVDASGPFSCETPDPYGIVKACLASNTHYIDLSDDPEFTRSISHFNSDARDKGLLVSSGASTVPAISGAIADELTRSLAQVEFIESTILPGNRAPRGLSLIQSVLHQTGRPFSIWVDGGEKPILGWSDQKRQKIQVSSTRNLKPRWSALIGGPDTVVFPDRYGAENVSVRAGLELSIMHLGLHLLSILPRMRLLKTLRPLARLLRATANLLKPFGSDEGGMRVDVGGRTKEGALNQSSWLLHAGSGEGPYIPALSAFILCEKIAHNEFRAGAGPCVDAISAKEIATALALLDTGTRTETRENTCLFEQALGTEWSLLPREIRDAHAAIRRRAFNGEARVERGTSLFAPLICALFRFPPTASKTPVKVVFRRVGGREIWQRSFGSSHFHSVLKVAKEGTGLIQERFGLFTFQIPLEVLGQELRFPVARGWILGVPIPKFLLPKSQAREFVDAKGRFYFEIELSLPLIGRIVRYEGWLTPMARNNPRAG